MSFKEAYAPYLDKWGMAQPAPGTVSGNGLRFTGEYVASLMRAGELTDDIKRSLRNVILVCEKSPGNISRFPGSPDQESVDDTVATLWWSKEVGDDFAKRWLAFGRKAPQILATEGLTDFEKRPIWRKALYPIAKMLGLTKYTYNTINGNPNEFNFDAWLGRQQQIVCHAQFIAGETPPLWRKLWWCAAVIMSAREDISHQDGKVLSWYLIKAAKGKSLLCDYVGRYWIKKFKEQTDLGLGRVLNDYMGPGPWVVGLTGEFGE